MVRQITILFISTICFIDFTSCYVLKNETGGIKNTLIGGQIYNYPLPHQVQIFSQDRIDSGMEMHSSFLCGGSLITYDVVITAAHCVPPIENGRFLVLAGSNELGKYQSSSYAMSFFSHAKYRHHEISEVDVALIKLANPLIGTNIKPIKMSIAPAQYGATRVNGFGYFDMTRKASDVVRSLDGLIVGCTYHVNSICVQYNYGEGVCNGDSGSGLVNANFELIGITSVFMGPMCGAAESVYTSVYYVRDFIANGLQKLSPNDELANDIVMTIKQSLPIFDPQPQPYVELQPYMTQQGLWTWRWPPVY